MSDAFDGLCRKTLLTSGVTVVTEAVPGVRSATAGIWIAAGARHEGPGQHGMAHFFEHMAFKGTAARSALDIARELDRLGGAANAYTGRETTCYYARVAQSGLFTALDVLTDIVGAPRLDPDDIELEKSVVLQEIAMVEETPDELLFDALWEDVWTHPALGHSILGEADTVAAYGRERLCAWRESLYSPDRVVVAAAGAVDHDAVAAFVAARLEGLPRPGGLPALPAAMYRQARNVEEHDTEQAHVAMAYPAATLTAPERHAQFCLNAILGGQMSSRLFQEVREKRGLAYSISSAHHGLTDGGLIEIYAAASPERAAELVAVTRAEIARLASGDVTADELEQAREHLLGLLFLSAESTEDRMTRLARNEMLFGRAIAYDETAAKLRAVTLEDVRAAAAQVLDPARESIRVHGPGASDAWLNG